MQRAQPEPGAHPELPGAVPRADAGAPRARAPQGRLYGGPDAYQAQQARELRQFKTRLRYFRSGRIIRKKPSGPLGYVTLQASKRDPLTF